MERVLEEQRNAYEKCKTREQNNAWLQELNKYDMWRPRVKEGDGMYQRQRTGGTVIVISSFGTMF